MSAKSSQPVSTIDITFDVPTVVAAWDIDDPRPTLRALVNRGLIEPTIQGRFQMHTLMAVHARSLWETAK